MADGVRRPRSLTCCTIRLGGSDRVSPARRRSCGASHPVASATVDSFYDPARSYDENYADGPFGTFAAPSTARDAGDHSVPRHRFLGLPVREPFGIPAGPLLNARFCAAAFAHGFDLCVYKTVRTRAHPAHPLPNVVPVHVDGDLTLEAARHPVRAGGSFAAPLSISNSFGVPSRDPNQWQPDIAAAVRAAGPGQILIGAFQGTRGAGDLVADNVRAARLVAETGAPVLELNLSCPNEGASDLLCFDAELVRRIVFAIIDAVDLPLLVKIAHFADDAALRRLVATTGRIVAGYSAINTIPAPLVDDAGMPALPGRTVSGVCGAGIRWAGLDMTRRLASLRDELSLDYAIVGVGGVANTDDYRAYREAGPDAVMSATGAMWNTGLATEIRDAARADPGSAG